MTLVVMLLVSLLLLVVIAIWTTARAILQPPRMSQGKAFFLLHRVNPADLALKYEPVSFHVDDRRHRKLRLAGWWIAHPAGGSKTVVLVHGYADAKVGAIAWAPLWQRLGYHVLAYDQRAHGESEGRYCTGGVRETGDLRQVIDQLRERFAMQTQHLVLFGISLGAFPALGVACGANNIFAAVVDCPFASYPKAVDGLSRQLRTPLRRLLPFTLRLAGWMGGVDWRNASNPIHISNCSCPVLAIVSENDPYVTQSDAQEIRRAIDTLGPPSRFWYVEAATHLRAIEADPVGYQQAIATFLDAIPSSN